MPRCDIPMLAPSDFLVLHGPLTEEAQLLLPIPAEAALYISDEEGILRPLLNPETEQETPVIRYPDREQPRIIGDHLVIPLPLEQMDRMALVIRAADPFLLKKLSPSWQKKFQEQLLPAWTRLRPIYIDPATDLYNQRAATAFLQESGPPAGFFFLLHTVFYKSSAANALQKLRELADIFQFFNIGPCFSFGYGVFGLFLQSTSREQALKTAHFLQRQLKRERMHKVQIAFVSTSSSQTSRPDPILERCWQALSIAEKRGPFSIYDRKRFSQKNRILFQLTSPELIRTMQADWRGQNRFTLAALSFSREVEDPQALRHIFKQDHLYLHHEDDPAAFLLLPQTGAEESTRALEEVRQKIQACYGPDVVAIGAASWPCLDFSKNDMPSLCLKALLHGSFLGPGSMVVLDHLSLNISGDACFEDGDYKAAIREYRRGLRLQAGEVNLLNSLGVALVECGQKRLAAQCFQDVLQQEPENYMALINLGHVRQAQGAQSDALHCFERAWQALDSKTEGSPSGQELFFPLARLYMEISAYDKAIGALERWHDRSENNRDFQLFRLMGQCYLELEEPQKAIRACQRSLHIFPRDSIALSILGLLYVEQGEGSEIGLDLCIKALELNRFNPDLWCNLGQAQRCMGKYNDALASIKQCLHVHPQHKEGKIQLALLCQLMNRKTEARRRLRKAAAEQKLSRRQTNLLHNALAALDAARQKPEERT